MINLPSTGSIQELAKTVEFIDLITSKKGLKEALDQIAEKKLEAEKLLSEAQALIRTQDDAVKKAQVAEKDLKETKDALEKTALEAQVKEREAQDRIDTAHQEELRLKKEKDEHKAIVLNNTAFYEEQNNKLTDRENAVSKREEEATKIVAEYNQKILELQEITR